MPSNTVHSELVCDAVLHQLVSLCHQAGASILSIYHQSSDVDVEYKLDNSPLTAADSLAHRILVDGLQARFPAVPILSEEGELPPFAERSQWCDYWLVDPLDGTKEFLSRNGEFTVNVALISSGVPVLGVVYAPVLDWAYAGARSLGARKIERDRVTAIQTRSLVDGGIRRGSIALVASRRHGAEAIDALDATLASRFGQIDKKAMGSSLKLCLVAEGQADLYPRFGPTSEWDTAAAQAIVEAAGGAVLDPCFMPLRYNQQESILNPNFLVVGDPHEKWSEIISLDGPVRR